MRLHQTDHPLLYEINSRVWLVEFARKAKKKTFTLADVPDAALDEIAELGFDIVWLMGVWQTGPLGEKLAREQANLLAEAKKAFRDFQPEDIVSSPYAVQDYKVAASLGGPKALAAFRKKLAERGIALMLDLVPNHTARDHAWVSARPEFYVHGDDDALRNELQNYFVAETKRGRRVLAHGRDPYFAGWQDTAQLNYQHSGLRAAMTETLRGIAGQCDGVRCDMSMLLLNDVFARTWGERAQPADRTAFAAGEFWPQAINAVRREHPEFIFMAEVYWGLEAELQAQGFNYTYDKMLYDRLLHEPAASIRGHLLADADFQARSARFLENHDEPRAAGSLPPEKLRAAALVCYTLPGLRFFYDGQLGGRKFREPVQFARRPNEKPDAALWKYYEALLRELGSPALRHGRWRPLEPRAAWEGNSTWDQFIAHRWEADWRGSRIAVANYGSSQGQCYVPLDLGGLRSRKVILRDVLSGVSYERGGDSLLQPGLFLDLAPYQFHLFTVEPAA